MSSPAIEECDVEQTLDAVESLWESRRAAEAEMFVRAAHFVDLHPAESLRAERRVLPGMERAVRLGGEGTPKVAEFACLELGARMQMGSWSAKRYIADALDTRHRLPLTWRRVRALEARVPFVRLVATKTRHLSVEAAATVDAALAPYVDGSLPWGRFEARLAGKVVAADPELAAQCEADRVAAQCAKRTRSSESGTAGFYVRSTIGVIARLEATVAYVADALKAFGDADVLDARRVKAVLVLCNPTTAVELLAAYAALRSRASDAQLPLEPDESEPEPEPGDRTAEEPQESWGPLDRMDTFARRVGFTPTHLPPWLTARWFEAPASTFDWSKAAAEADDEPPPCPRGRPSRHRWRRALGRREPGHAPVCARPSAAVALLRHSAGDRPRRPSTGGRLRDPGPTSTGRASADAGRQLTVLLAPRRRPTRRAGHRPHRGVRRRALDRTGEALVLAAGQLRAAPPVQPPAQDPRAVDGAAAVQRRSSSGATRTVRSTWSTTPAPTRSPGPGARRVR